jgi:DNA-binding transcriptional LysR family regulator
VRLGNFDAVCRMVGAGVGVAVIPQTAAQRCRRNTAIRVSRLADPWALGDCMSASAARPGCLCRRACC